MKIGLGLYRHMLTRDYYDFARQAGCTHVVVHLVDYFNQSSSNPRNNQPTGGKYEPWGFAGNPDELWTVKQLRSLRADIEEAGLVLAAIENLNPAHWHDILLDGPQRSQQIENVKTIIRRLGEAGIPVLGYNFSLAGVCGRVSVPLGRGHAVTVGMNGPTDDVPVPNGTVWNMVYDRNAPPGNLPAISHEELWHRLQRFLEEVIPAAERLRITEIFHSLQGEADTAGWPTVFVRLTGCPLRCGYCDTTYAFHGGQWWELPAVLERVRELGAR